MGEQKVMNRKLVVIGAILIQLCLGAIYAWSVFTPSLTAKSPSDIAAIYSPATLGLDAAKANQMADELKAPRLALKELKNQIKGESDKAKVDSLKAEAAKVTGSIDAIVTKYVAKEELDARAYGLNNTQTQAIFSAGLAAFAVVMVLAGRRLPKLGPRKLAMAGGLVLGLGYVLAGLVAGKSFLGFLILVGLVGGSGIGLGYVVPIATGMKWFPDKKGLITGLAVAGFGFGALLWVKLAGDWGRLIATAGLPGTFMLYGVIFFVACLVGSIWMVNPPEGWKPCGWTPPVPKPGQGPAAGAVDFTSGEMLATPQFYMIFLCFAFGAGAGLMTIGLMNAFPAKALVASGLSADEASAIAGTAMAVFFALANGIGRIAWGTLSDKIGRKPSIVVMMASQGIIVILFQWMAGTEGLLYAGATLIGFNFGGNFALFPTITADTFGAKYVGQNYGWVFLSYGVGGILGPILGGKLGDMGNFPLAFTICGVLCLLASVIITFVKRPAKATV